MKRTLMAEEMKKQYIPTPQIDDTLRRIYQSALCNKIDRKGLPSIKRYARKIGWTEYQIYKRAGELGLVRPRKQEWSEGELAYLTRLAHLTPRTIYERFRKVGYKRTPNAIYLKLWENNLRSESNYYTARQLGLCLGYENGQKVVRWITNGSLKAERRGSDRQFDNWLIHEKEIRAFILENPMEIDLRKVDQTWFFDIMFEGKAGVSVAQVLKKEEVRFVDEDDDSAFDEDAVIRHLIESAEYPVLENV